MLIAVCGKQVEIEIPKHWSVKFFSYIILHYNNYILDFPYSEVKTEVFYFEFPNYLKINKTWVKRFSQWDWGNKVAESY